MILLNKSDAAVSRWSGGSTAQLMISPYGSLYQNRTFDFRISIAEIEDEHSAFTPLPDYNRVLVSLSPQITLQNGTVPVTVAQYAQYAFDGGDAVESFGRATDFGVMCRKGVCTPKVEVITLEKNSVYRNSGAYVYAAEGYVMETEGGIRVLSDRAVLIAVQIVYDLILVEPDERHEAIWNGAMADFAAAGEPPNTFGKNPSANYAEYLKELRHMTAVKAITYDAKYGFDLVPCSVYFLTDSAQTQIFGAIHIRWLLTPSLRKFGGNIGFGVVPSMRRKGYGTKMLELALEQCRKTGLFAVMLTCDADNKASSRTMLRCGAQRYATDIREDGTPYERYCILL